MLSITNKKIINCYQFLANGKIKEKLLKVKHKEIFINKFFFLLLKSKIINKSKI